MPNPASIRLGTSGKAQVKADLVEIGDTGAKSFKTIGDASEAQAKRWSRSYENAGRDVEAALQRQQTAAEKIAAIMPQTAVQMRIADTNGTGFGQYEGSARSSAAVFIALEAEQQKLEARTRALVSAIDPAFAAQQRFNHEIGEARALVSAGTLSLDQYVAVLRKEQAAVDAVSGGHKVFSNSAGATRQAMQGLSYQLQDTFTQISMGTNVLQVAAIQGGQVAGQFSNLEGKAGNVARFMIGPWGLAMTAAALVLGPLLGKIINTNSAIDDAIERLKKDAKETDNTRIAKERFARSADGVAISIREQARALDDAAKGERSAAERANILAKENLKREMAIRAVTAALLDQAIAQEDVDKTRSMAPGQRGELGTLALTESSGRVAGLQAQLKANQTAIDLAKRNLMGTRIDLATDAAGRAADPMAQIKKRYDDLADAARSTARARVKVGQDVDASLTRELATIERNRAAAVKVEQDKQKASQETSRQYGREVTSSQASAIARAAGLQVNSADRSTARQTELYNAWIAKGRPKENPVAKPGTSAHERGNALDIQFEAGVTARKIRDAFAAEGVRLTKIFAEKGHWHIEWARTSAQKTADVDAAKATRAAAAANKELDSSLEEIVMQFDPARAAGEEYAATLAKIAALRGAGKLTAGQADDYGFAAFKEAQAAAQQRQTQMAKTVLGDFDDPFEASNAAREGEKDAWSQEFERRQQVQENGVRNVSSLYRNLMSGGTRSIFDSFRQRGLDAIADLAAKWTISQIGKMSESGGFLGSVATLLKGTGGSTPAYASGTEYASGGASIVGEFGKEIVNLPRGSRVTPAAETRRMLAGNDNPPAIHIDASIYAPGADGAALARVEAAQQQMMDELPGTVLAIYRDGKSRRYI
ncbi:phage tail length tape measure family protein [Sphingomonas sp. R86521]|uniref:phage tail length tape measure family protein n=1 Tax=Sphingomonas sp. R86521 TaxID=3093860 RepID=UPI0036D29DF8